MSSFSIKRGNPTPEEIAIAITVLKAAAAAQDIATPAALASRHSWAAPVRQHRASTHHYGNGAWVLSNRIR